MKRNILFCFVLSLFVSQTIGSSILGTTPIGEECDNHDDCVGQPNVNSHCVKEDAEPKGVCACMTRFVPKSDNQDCLPFQDELHKECLESAQCQAGIPGSHSVCTESLCVCTDQAVEIPGAHFCFPRANKLYEGCLHPQQCTANLGDLTECNANSICSCKTDTVPKTDNSTCLAKAGHAQPCEIHAQCQYDLGEHAQCTNSRCACSGTSKFFEGKCYAEKKLEEACTEDNECKAHISGDTRCNNNRCSCNATTEVGSEAKTACLLIQNDLDGACQESLQCQAGRPGRHSTCVGTTTRKCDCTDEAVRIDGQHMCFPKATKIGDSCIHPPQCLSNLGDKSECSGEENAKKCNCVADHVPNSDSTSCLAKAGHQEECEVHAQCVDLGEHAECTDKACTCVHQSKFHAEKCRALTKLDGACTENDDCQAHITGATSCVNNKCVCDAGEDREGDNKCTGGTVKIGGLYLLNFVLFAVTILNYFK